jgi:ubiquitin C-terminal hydrolase
MLNILGTTNTVEVQQQVSLNFAKKPYHQAGEFTKYCAQMEWTVTHVPGVGLNNIDNRGNCKNICYINAIIQCFANTAPFVNWLLTDRSHDKCK